MGRETRQKLARAFARRMNTEQEQHDMRTGFLNKALSPEATKLSPAQQAAFDHNTRNLALSPAEQSEVGRRVALVAEAVNRDKPYRISMRAAAEPTRAEAEELARALAAYDAILERRATARAWFADAEQEVGDSLEAGGSWSRDDADAAARTARAQAALAAAEQAFRLVDQELAFSSQAVGRARGAINAGGAARQRRVVASF